MEIIIIIAALALFGVGALYHRGELSKLKKEHESIVRNKDALLSNVEDEYKALSDLTQQRTDENARLKAENEELSQFKAILDVESEVERIRREARAYKQRADADAEKTIAEANRQAEEIAGEAIQLRDKKDELKKLITALENKVKGYDDIYVIPTREFIDELAEEYDHKEAGIKLKEARARTKDMIDLGIAATCEYAETKRRNTAISFVLYAFNGLVDAILTRVKHDNFGKLKQEIIDGFMLINHNGAAFRNARITEDYLAARQDELRWAVAVHELRQREREEQRQIKEAMREEERARREYEKAIREAEKEEKMLQTAMEQARQELESANEQQRLALEQQIAELQQKYEEAESRNQRALSMAQQTRRGHVYVISNIGSFGDDVYKIGLTRRLEPMDRVKELGDASVPFEFDVHAMIYHEDAPTLERELHQVFNDKQVNKSNPRKEFFKLKISEIKEAVLDMGIDVHWTLAAEAREYRESIIQERKKAEPLRTINDKPVQAEYT